jgi:hypothetical protein
MTFENQNNRVDSKPALGNFFNEHDKKKTPTYSINRN